MNDKEKCIKGIVEHIDKVRENLIKIIKELINRSVLHDDSKFYSPELEIFITHTPKLAESTFGSKKYKQFLKEMDVAIKHHHKHNKHHPEYFEKGIRDMNLIDITEMLCDWKAATLRHKDGDIYKSINLLQKKFKYSNELKQILVNTVNFLEGVKT